MDSMYGVCDKCGEVQDLERYYGDIPGVEELWLCYLCGSEAAAKLNRNNYLYTQNPCASPKFMV